MTRYRSFYPAASPELVVHADAKRFPFRESKEEAAKDGRRYWHVEGYELVPYRIDADGAGAQSCGGDGMTQAQMYRHTRILAAPAKRATPDEAVMLHHLAAKAVALAAEYGETLTFAEGLQRARENMADVRLLALAKEVVS